METVGITRRRLLQGAVVAGTATAVGRPHWAAAIRSGLEDAATRLLRAYVSTLVPGPADDPRGTAGAVEAGAVQQLRAQAPYVIPPLLADITTAAVGRTGRDFASLPYRQREALLVEAFADPRRAPYHLVALAIGAGSFYGDFRNRTGGRHMGFPGPSNGYLATYTDRTGYGQPESEAIPP